MINIVTIFRFGIIKELENTIDSLLSQKNAKFNVIFVLSEATDADILWLKKKLNKQFYYKLIINKDKSLYNAMNIALHTVKEGEIFFLNGGDAFCHSSSAANLLKSCSKDRPTIFSTIQTYKDDRYLREASSSNPAHQGFLINTSLIGDLAFNENLSIAADHYWMLELIERYGCYLSNETIAEFHLGGLSNHPCLKSIKARYRTQGIFRALKETLKFILISFLGPKNYYRLLLGAPKKREHK